jgi:hypothetical protein
MGADIACRPAPEVDMAQSAHDRIAKTLVFGI